MKKFMIIALTVATLAGATLAGVAQNHHGHTHGKPAASSAKKGAFVCPVTGDRMASVKKTTLRSVYKGKTYYFCCAGCKPRFDKYPAKYVKNAAKGKFERM